MPKSSTKTSSTTSATTTTTTRATRSTATAAATAAVAPPKTVLDKVLYAIRQQPKTSRGAAVSRLQIHKYLIAELDYDNMYQLQRALKKGVDTGILRKEGHSSFVLIGAAAAAVDDSPIATTTTTPPVAEEEEEKVTCIDLVVGKGDVCTERGDSLTVKYVGKLQDDTMFDAESSFEFTLGAGDVLAGWDQGDALLGLKVGGKRKLIVPPKLGYDNSGSSRGPDIPPDSTLYFEITLRQLTKGGASSSPLL